jgi:hypothetical protein
MRDMCGPGRFCNIISTSLCGRRARQDQMLLSKQRCSFVLDHVIEPAVADAQIRELPGAMLGHLSRSPATTERNSQDLWIGFRR